MYRGEWVIVLVLTQTGCSTPTVQLFPVTGEVLVGDKLVPSGMVQFRADVERGNTLMEVPTGLIQSDGRFTISTNGKPGAPAGWYRVIIMADNFTTGDPPMSPEWPKMPKGHPKPLVHERYLYFHQTDVLVEVVANPSEDTYVFRLNP